jgi:hypothetical protein
MITKKRDSIKELNILREKQKLADGDYRIIKAMELAAAEKLEELYPGEHERREAIREKIREMSGE